LSKINATPRGRKKRINVKRVKEPHAKSTPRAYERMDVAGKNENARKLIMMSHASKVFEKERVKKRHVAQEVAKVKRGPIGAILNRFERR
jgi:hypothetical protein